MLASSEKMWAKTSAGKNPEWHPLILHMVDVAACADAIMAREPESSRKSLAGILGMEWQDALPWLLLVIACHDLGKASPGFQSKWTDMTGLRTSRSPNTKANHGFVSQIALTCLLQERGWPLGLATLTADAVGCHHGNRAAPTALDYLMGDVRAIGGNDWEDARRDLVDALLKVFLPTSTPTRKSLTGPDFMLLSGLASFADWIGSNEEWFPFGAETDCADLVAWFGRSRARADVALDRIGWQPRLPLSSGPKSFEQVFSFPPRPLQTKVAEAVATWEQPSVLLVEAPMGEGKTEAAFFAHLELQRRFGHRGMYVALPTKATGNAMFQRTIRFLGSQEAGRTLDLQLLHGAVLLNESFQLLRLSGIHGEGGNSEIRAQEWFTHKKRALLSEYGVGTVDQALLPILPVRHNFVRLWGLANRVVVFDEIHAYDTYTGTLLLHLIRWLLAMGASVLLLSATLPPSVRRKLAAAVGGGLPEQEADYPRVTSFRQGAVQQEHFAPDPSRRQTVRVEAIPATLCDIRSALDGFLPSSGMGLVLVNTVQRAQELFLLLGQGDAIEHEGRLLGKRLEDGTEVFLFHARYPAGVRQGREDHALATFGPERTRSGRKILVATQVVEQSLDLDFDVMISDLAPIDLLLQRAGRLWRHHCSTRPVQEPVLLVAGLAGDAPPPFDKPLWWGAVYREDVLLRTWALLHDRRSLTVPDDIDPLVRAVYDEQGPLPESLQERLEAALLAGEGAAFAQKLQADRAVIGLPDDASWNRPENFVLYDEDEPGLHRTLMAQTRLGDTSVTAIPVNLGEQYEQVPQEPAFARSLYLRAISITRQGVVRKLQQLGAPEGWQKSPLLRNSIPLLLDGRGCWVQDESVRLDDQLGLVYQTTEES